MKTITTEQFNALPDDNIKEMKNEIEILEQGTQLFMPDTFTGNTILMEIGPDKSGSIQIIGEAGSKPLSVCLWPDDLKRLKDFILNNTDDKFDIKKDENN